MLTSAELRRMRRLERWMGILVPRVARRVVDGKVPQPGWLPRRWLTVVSGDVDFDGGIGAVWLVWRPGSAKAETHTALIERCGGQWQYTGGGSASGGDVAADRSAAGQPVQVGVIELGGRSGGVSTAWRLQHRDRSVVEAPWVEASEVQAAAEVDHLLIGERRRRVEVPGHGRLIVAWESRSTGNGGLRPLIVAVGRDGSELSRIGPHDSLDSYTWAKLGSRQELNLWLPGGLAIRRLPWVQPCTSARAHLSIRTRTPAGRRVLGRGAGSVRVYLPGVGPGVGACGVPGEPVPDDAAGLRAANARLRGLLADRDASIAGLRLELDAERELRRRLELRLAELERRLGMDSSNSGTPGSKERIGAREARRSRQRQESERERSKDRRRGGQPGHPGKGLARDPEPGEKRDAAPPAECRRCTASLAGAVLAGQRWAQSWDVRITRIVCEWLL